MTFPLRMGGWSVVGFRFLVVILLAGGLGIFEAQLSWGQSGVPADVTPAREYGARIEEVLEVLGKTKTPESVAMSPDGSYVAWSVMSGRGYELHLTGLAPEGTAQDGAWERVISPDTIGNVTNVKAGRCGARAPVWSPDGRRLAFLSSCREEGSRWEVGAQDEIFVWTLADNELKQETQVFGTIDALAWSPDGKAIGFLFVENATRTAGALAAMKPWSGVIGEDGVEVQRVAVLDLATQAVAQVTPASLHVYEFDWSPDGKRLAYIAANPPGENNWWVAELYTQDLTLAASPGRSLQGSNVHAVLTPVKVEAAFQRLQIAVPRWSPDGTRIALIGGLMSDQGSTGGDLYVLSAAGGELKDLTPNRAASVVNFAWRGDGKIAIAEVVGGSSHLALLDLATGNDAPEGGAKQTFPETIGAGGATMSISAATRGRDEVAFVRSSFELAPEVWAGPLGNLRQISHLNDGLAPVWGKTENIVWENDGFKLQGWLLYPAGWSTSDATNGKKYPLLVSVHGGPSGVVTPYWPGVSYDGVPFSALGYFVFLPNPRGSFGQGERFTEANVKDFGYGDLRDILKGMDVLEQRFPIDTNREGLTGWSYGGFMTMFGVTQTTRFRAAVAGAGISDWKSYYGENSIDQWMVPFFGATVYDDPAVYLKSSAIEYIKQVKTPTLVVVGDRDGECPAPQSFEFWHALRAEGVKTQLVVYPNEGHSFHDPEHRRDVLERAMRWFEMEMPAVQ